MLNYNIDTFDAASRFVKMCEKYKDKMEIDVCHGRQIIDGYSILGVCSLVGNIVSVEPITDDKDVINKFRKDLEELSGKSQN